MKSILRAFCLFFLIISCQEMFANPFSFDFNLIGGRPALRNEYPEIIYIRSGNARCTATVVGESVILTAGHCVKDQGEIGPVEPSRMSELDVEFVVDQTVYTAKCRQAPLYRDQSERHQDHDMALCKTDKLMSVKPASVSTTGPEVGDMVVLTGYGCTSASGGGNDGVLRVGKAEVIQLPEGNDYTFHTRDSVAVCFGDSGGPSLLNTVKHQVIGVNSKGDIRNLSLLTALFTPASIRFMQNFSRNHQVDICGVTKKC